VKDSSSTVNEHRRGALLELLLKMNLDGGGSYGSGLPLSIDCGNEPYGIEAASELVYKAVAGVLKDHDATDGAIGRQTETKPNNSIVHVSLIRLRGPAAIWWFMRPGGKSSGRARGFGVADDRN
jgi:hypothetical protein